MRAESQRTEMGNGRGLRAMRVSLLNVKNQGKYDYGRGGAIYSRGKLESVRKKRNRNSPRRPDPKTYRSRHHCTRSHRQATGAARGQAWRDAT